MENLVAKHRVGDAVFVNFIGTVEEVKLDTNVILETKTVIYTVRLRDKENSIKVTCILYDEDNVLSAPVIERSGDGEDSIQEQGE